MPRFDQSFSGLCEQNLQDTLHLKQRFLDAKSKRVSKAKDKKQEAIQSSVHVQQKFLKRSGDELEPGGPLDNFEPPLKLQCTAQQQGGHQNEVSNQMKFSVEIVQQLEFTTSAASSQPQQISTNVTVKTHANASVKSDVSSPKAPTPGPSGHQQKANIGLDVGTLVECVKQEPENDFADLDQCAAALEKDAAANGASAFAGLQDLIGDDNNPDLKKLFNEINYSELLELANDGMKGNVDSMPMPLSQLQCDLQSEDIKEPIQAQNQAGPDIKLSRSPMTMNQNFSQQVFDKNPAASVNARLPYSNMDFIKTELRPAAQTLKQMAEQHQHKQQYSPYGSPGQSGSPGGFLNSGRGSAPGGVPFGAGTPPQAPFSSGGNQSSGGNGLQINQAQQLHITQQNSGHIQVSAAQKLHLNTDTKGNVSVAAQQGMHFSQHATPSGPQQSQQSAPGSQHATHQNPQGPMSQVNHGQMPGNINPMSNQMGGSQMGGHQGLPGMQSGLGGMMGGPGLSHGGLMNDSYSMSQSQTINFTQQSLRRTAAPTGMGGTGPGPMNNPGVPLGPRLMSAQALEQQKLQMLRAQALQHQQSQQQHRPPPPEYKASTGLGQGLQQRYAAPPPHNMRRMPHQPIPPSGPMIRSNSYMLQQQQQQQQQQQMAGRAMFNRQPGPIGSMESMQQNPEWRHLIMSQQQNANFNSIRPPFQQGGFNMNMAGGPLQQMSQQQHQQQLHQQQQQQQQMRAQQASMGGNQGNIGQMMGGQGPMSQLGSHNNMNLLHMQQQQSLLQQNPQMLSSIHMQQAQSMSAASAALQQQPGPNAMGNPVSAQGNANNPLASFNAQANDFNFEFLDNLPGAGDGSTLTDQELFSSLGADGCFNLDF